jgi:hypothetical protein
LLANAFCHPPYLYLTHCLRQQAGAYRAAPSQLIFPTLRVATQPQTLCVSQTMRVQVSEMDAGREDDQVAFGGVWTPS